MARGYSVNYGQTPQQHLALDKPFTNRRAAMHDAASAVRELGAASWAVVKERHIRYGGDVVLAEWRGGQRITPAS